MNLGSSSTSASSVYIPSKASKFFANVIHLYIFSYVLSNSLLLVS